MKHCEITLNLELLIDCEFTVFLIVWIGGLGLFVVSSALGFISGMCLLICFSYWIFCCSASWDSALCTYCLCFAIQLIFATFYYVHVPNFSWIDSTYFCWSSWSAYTFGDRNHTHFSNWAWPFFNSKFPIYGSIDWQCLAHWPAHLVIDYLPPTDAYWADWNHPIE